MNYHVTNDLFVMDENGATISGPYKNRKSAVGRISDLKKREAATEPETEYGKFKLDPVAFAKSINPATPAIASMDNYVPLRHAPISRPAGVYPHVSKHAYQR